MVTKEIQTQAEEASKTYWTKKTWQEKQDFVRSLDNKVLAAMSNHTDIVEDVKKLMAEHPEYNSRALEKNDKEGRTGPLS
jgi:glutaredoxin 2